SAGGILGATRDVSDPLDGLAGFPKIGLDGNGNAVFAWEQATPIVVKERRLSQAGTFGSIVALSAVGDNAQGPRSAVDSAGDVLFSWNAFNGSTGVPRGRALSAADVLGP